MKIHRATNSRRKFQEGIHHTPMMEFAITAERIRPNTTIEHVLLHIEPGHDFVYHRHDFAYDIFYVVKGDLVVTTNGNHTPLATGDALITEPPEMHTIYNRGAEDALLVETRVNVIPGDFFDCESQRHFQNPPQC